MGERMGRIETDFSDSNTRILSQKIKKNPFESAPSVLPLYRHFPNEKRLLIFNNLETRFGNGFLT
jgi:hypothetical protein